MTARRSNAHFKPLPGVQLLSGEGFGRIEVALPEGVVVESEEGIEALSGAPLVFVAGEQGRGGAFVFVDSLGRLVRHSGQSWTVASSPHW